MSAYIGRTKCCGRITAAVADWTDTPAHRKSTAQDVADMIKKGYIVEHVEDEVIKITKEWGCKCQKTLIPE